jgi:hypothetical protein
MSRAPFVRRSKRGVAEQDRRPPRRRCGSRASPASRCRCRRARWWVASCADGGDDGDSRRMRAVTHRTCGAIAVRRWPQPALALRELPPVHLPLGTQSTRCSCVTFALLAVACGAPPPAVGDAYVGVREWIGPGQSGCLELRSDRSSRLSLLRRTGEREETSGVWTAASEGVVLHVYKSSAGPITVDGPAATIDVLINGDCATYLGAGGVVDLNWGF